MSTEVAQPESPPGRIVGVDIARALAILGMLAVHIGPTDVGGFVGRFYAAPYGRASLLFVFVAGVGITLLTRSTRSSSSGTRIKLAWRAALLLPAGLALQELDHGANVILQDYALFFVLAMLAIDLSRRWLLALAIGFATMGPVVYFLGRAVTPAAFERTPTTLSDPLLATVQGLVFSGPYPLITWGAPLLFGMWLGRLDLRSAVLRRRMVIGGGAVALVAFLLPRYLVAIFGPPTSFADARFLYTSSGHGQMPMWLVGGTAVAVALLGLALYAGDRAPRLTWPFTAAGQLALTVYVGHLLVLHAIPERATSERLPEAFAILAAFTAVILVGSALWRHAFDRGPLEYALHPTWLPTALPGSAPAAAPEAADPAVAQPIQPAHAGTPTPAMPVRQRRPLHGNDPSGSGRVTRDRAVSP